MHIGKKINHTLERLECRTNNQQWKEGLKSGLRQLQSHYCRVIEFVKRYQREIKITKRKKVNDAAREGGREDT